MVEKGSLSWKEYILYLLDNTQKPMTISQLVEVAQKANPSFNKKSVYKSISHYLSKLCLYGHVNHTGEKGKYKYLLSK